MSRLAIKRIQTLVLGIALALSCTCLPVESLAEEGEQTDHPQQEEGQQEDGEQAEEQKTEEQKAEEPQAQIEISAPSAVLMEASTGTVIYEKDADIARPPASVTKVMTMLLIFDALEAGSIHLEDEVTTSEYAASMGGSQVFLEPGETQTVDTMLKCIAVASANDACVAMAEYICGSEEEFVRKMNERAAGDGQHELCELQRPGCRRTRDEREGYCSYVTGADHEISTGPRLFDDLDGKYHPQYKQRRIRVRACEHE